MAKLDESLFITSIIDIKESIEPNNVYNSEDINEQLLEKIKKK